jgi:hypothetical protein
MGISLQQWFPTCTVRIPRDLQSRVSVHTFCNGYFEVNYFLLKIIEELLQLATCLFVMANRITNQEILCTKHDTSSMGTYEVSNNHHGKNMYVCMYVCIFLFY